MADLTAVTTFQFSVQGNRRVVYCDISSAGFTTSDTVTVPYLSAIQNIIEASFRTTVWDPAATTAMVGPFVNIGSSANTMQIARSSLAAFPCRVIVEGR